MERIVDAYWEGPFKWGELENNITDCHVLYAVYGMHPVYGYESLLYIGKTKKIRTRMVAHAWWVEDEYEEITVRAASLGKIKSWDGWYENERYRKTPCVYIVPTKHALTHNHINV